MASNGHSKKPKLAITLYSMAFCPYAQRTRLVLAAKHLQFETINIDLSNKPDYFLKLNPNGEVPVLQHNNDVVFESAICNEYLEDTFPEHPLLPKEPSLRARARLLVDFFNKKLCSAFYKVLKSTTGTEAELKDAKEALDKNLVITEHKLAESTGQYFVGDSVTLADYAIFPWMQRLIILEKLANYHLPEECKKLKQWHQLMNEDAAVKTTVYDPDKLVLFYDKYRIGKPDFSMTPGKDEVLENLDALRDPNTRQTSA